MSLLTPLVVLSFLFIPTLARFDLNRRQLVCVQDDVYNAFHSAPPDNVDPWCASYLGISDVSSTSHAYTSRTTTITTTTTFTPALTTTTVPAYVGTTTSTEGALGRRVAQAPAPTAMIASINASQTSSAPLYQTIMSICEESPANASVISAARSACSCLFLQPRTIPIYDTTTSTVTQTAVDYEPSRVVSTDAGFSTLTVTVVPTPIVNSTSTIVGTGSSAPFINRTVPVTTSAAPPPQQSFSVCPASNGTIQVESDGEHFLILCNVNFPGNTDVGLDEPTWSACVQQCALDNDGFSGIICYGVSYFPNTIGPNCYLKTQSGVATQDYNPSYQIVSGLLLPNTTSNGTNTTTASPSAPAATYPGGPGFNLTQNPRGGSAPTSSSAGLGTNTTNTTNTAPSAAATIYPGPPGYNLTGNPRGGGYPTAPYSPPTNTTSVYGPTAPPVSSNSSASMSPSNSYNVTSPSALPTNSYNYTIPPFPTGTGSPRNASTCMFTETLTTYVSTCVDTSTNTVTVMATNASHTSTITQVFTITA